MVMPKRYRWAKKSDVYHDMHYSVERCNVDDLKDYEEGDEPPPQVRHARNKRLCRLCQTHRNQVEMSEWRSPEQPYATNGEPRTFYTGPKPLDAHAGEQP